MSDCIFCKIVQGQMDTNFIYEDDYLVVFADIRPKATTHLLFTSKKHITSLMAVTDEDTALLGHMLETLPKVAKKLGIKGFRTVINSGRESGQEVDHLHFHLLAGSIPNF